MVDSDFMQIIKLCTTIPVPPESELASRKIKIGDQIHPKTIIFDLDETLVSASAHYFSRSKFKSESDLTNFSMKFKREGKMKLDFEINTIYDEDTVLNIKVVVRPHVKEVLEYLSQRFELGIFTAGS